MGNIKKKKRSRTARVRFGPGRYILKDVWRNRSRTFMSVSSIAALSFLFVIFASMDNGFDEMFEDDVGVPSREMVELQPAKLVMENWVLLITGMCVVLMVLIIANTGLITVVERRTELASLRAIGISAPKVSMLVGGSLGIILYSGLVLGTLLGLAAVPVLDRTNLNIFSEGIGFPFKFDMMIFIQLVLLGTISGIVGSLFPLFMMFRNSPLEVLRDG